ncbi:MAG: hypothetical protein JST20_10570 [Bacteroidetes bacterium]|nr:hypothetical protein [Bacteroidota bacterium]
MKSILLLLSCLALCLSSVVVAPTIHAQVPDSCLKLLWAVDSYPYYNPDSVCVDSCIGSSTFGERFARETFAIIFTQTIVFLPWAPHDSIIDFSWTAIDTSFPAIRSAFQQLESDFGTLWLRKFNPDDTSLNTLGNRAYYLRFASRVPIDSIVSRLSSMQLIDLANYDNQADIVTGIPNDRGMKVGSPITDIYVHNSTFSPGYYTFYSKNWHRLGWHWNLYKIQAPMAWEITTGKSSVMLCAGDRYPSNGLTHPDLGNVTNTTNKGNGIDLTYPFGTGDHGETVICMAVAKGDNDGNLTDRKGMVGTCPNCTGLCLRGIDRRAARYDVDNDVALKVWQHFDALNFSYGGIGRSTDEANGMKESIDSGIVVISAAGNDRSQFGKVAKINTSSGNVWEYRPAANYPGAFAWTDATDIQKDVRVLCVGQTKGFVSVAAEVTSYDYDMADGDCDDAASLVDNPTDANIGKIRSDVVAEAGQRTGLVIGGLAYVTSLYDVVAPQLGTVKTIGAFNPVAALILIGFIFASIAIFGAFVLAQKPDNLGTTPWGVFDWNFHKFGTKPHNPEIQYEKTNKIVKHKVLFKLKRNANQP